MKLLAEEDVFMTSPFYNWSAKRTARSKKERGRMRELSLLLELEDPFELEDLDVPEDLEVPDEPDEPDVKEISTLGLEKKIWSFLDTQTAKFWD